MTWQLQLQNASATEKLGALLATTAPPSAIIYLRGDLGAGKTSLARAMLQALGAVGPIKSPTYTLIERYPLTVGEAAHLDLYRIAETTELEFLGLDELADEARLWLIEWPDRGRGALPEPDLEIELSVAGEGRNAQLHGRTAKGQSWVGSASNYAPCSDPP